MRPDGSALFEVKLTAVLIGAGERRKLRDSSEIRRGLQPYLA
jgi:hypothetical protein